MPATVMSQVTTDVHSWVSGEPEITPAAIQAHHRFLVLGVQRRCRRKAQEAAAAQGGNAHEHHPHPHHHAHAVDVWGWLCVSWL